MSVIGPFERQAMLRRSIIAQDGRHRPRVFERGTGARTSAMFVRVSITRVSVETAVLLAQRMGLVVDGYTN